MTIVPFNDSTSSGSLSPFFFFMKTALKKTFLHLSLHTEYMVLARVAHNENIDHQYRRIEMLVLAPHQKYQKSYSHRNDTIITTNIIETAATTKIKSPMEMQKKIWVRKKTNKTTTISITMEMNLNR